MQLMFCKFGICIVGMSLLFLKKRLNATFLLITFKGLRTSTLAAGGGVVVHCVCRSDCLKQELYILTG